jgi:hypothetical protein
MASAIARFESSGFLPVGTAPVDNQEALHRIVDARQVIHNYPGIFERMPWFVMRLVEA